MLKTIFFSFIISFSFSVNAQNSTEASYFTMKDGAIRGYDPVAYFTLNKPTQGIKSIYYNWKGVNWYFVSEENKKMFIKDSDKYAPQYGGYCAYGWAKGYAVKTEPDAWSIVGGKLYLNYSKGVQKDWDKDREGYIKQANANYARR